MTGLPLANVHDSCHRVISLAETKSAFMSRYEQFLYLTLEACRAHWNKYSSKKVSLIIWQSVLLVPVNQYALSVLTVVLLQRNPKAYLRSSFQKYLESISSLGTLKQPESSKYF